MKTTSLRIVTLLAIFLTLVKIDALGLTTVTRPTIFVFGTDGEDISIPSKFDSFDKVYIKSVNFSTGVCSGTELIEITEGEGSTKCALNASYMHHRRCLKLSGNSASKLYMYIRGVNEDDSGSSTRELQVNGNEIASINNSSTELTYSIISSGDIKIDTKSYGWCNVYYIAWEPDTRTLPTLTLSASATSISVYQLQRVSVSSSANDILGNVRLVTSDASVLNIDSSWSGGGQVSGKSAGTATLTAVFDGDETYMPATSEQLTFTVAASPFVETGIRTSDGSNPASTLGGRTMGMTTNDNIDISTLIDVYSVTPAVVTSQGTLTVTSLNTDLTVSGTTISAGNATEQGRLMLQWKPGATTYPYYSAATLFDSAQFTLTSGTDVSNKSGAITTSISDEILAADYFQIQLTEPITTSVQLGIEYDGGPGSNSGRMDYVDYRGFSAGTSILWVPIANGKNKTSVTKINLSATSGSTTIAIDYCNSITASYAPASALIDNIVVTGDIHLNQVNTIYYTGTTNKYVPRDVSVDNVFEGGSPKATYTLGKQTINGKTYTEVPYDYLVTVKPTFTTDDDTEYFPSNYSCLATRFETDEDGNAIEAFRVGNNSTNKGYITPMEIAYGEVAVGANPGGYTKTQVNTGIIIVKAAPHIWNPSGGSINSLYDEDKLSLNTVNSVDLTGKFAVFDKQGTNITSYGDFSYTSSELTINGSEISCSTARTSSNPAQLRIIWTPKTEYAGYYESVYATIFKIYVEDAAAGYIMSVDPTNITIIEADDYALSNFTVSVVSDGSAAAGTLSYSVDDATYLEVDGTNLHAKKSDLTGNRKLTITWTDGTITKTKDVIVNIKKRLAISASSSSITMTQGDTQALGVTLFNDVNNNGVQDTGEDTVTDVTPSWTVTDFLNAADNSATAYLRVSQADGKVTALNAGKGPDISQGTAEISIAFNGNTTYSTASATVNVTVNDNTCLDYIGWDLAPGHSGTLYNPNNTSQKYLHWRFGSPAGVGVNVFRYNNPAYSFSSEGLVLKDKIHKSECSFDPFYETKLTNTGRVYLPDGSQADAKGDAFLEYNGMVAGYGTESGGRYLTPITGTFVRVEAEYDGVVTVRLRHNGSLDSSDIKGDEDNGYDNIKQARRALYVIDENGVVMPRTTNYATLDACGILDTGYRTALKDIDGTYARIGDESKVTSTFNVVNDAYTQFFNSGENTNVVNGISYTVGSGNNVDFSKNAFHFCRNIIYDEYGDANATLFNSEVREGFIQKLFYSDEEDDVAYQAPGVDSKTYFFSKYGYEVLGATHLVISFPVKAGKTYFVAANKSKIGMCSVEFDPVATSSYSITDVTLDEDATASSTSISWLKNTADGAHLNVTLNRTFVPYRWHPLVLPFSVSETQLRSIFGENVSVIALDGSLKMLSSMNNYATRDGDFYDTTTLISGAGRIGNSIPFNGSVIKESAIRDGSVTFTHHWYQMIYAHCPVFLWFDGSNNVEDPTFTNVTFQKYTKDKTDAANTEAINADYTVNFPYKVDRQIGDGSTYNYVMKASYVKTIPSYETYYVTNVGSGISTKAHLYHAQTGKAPVMKGMRVWIEPVVGSRSEPLRSISMRQYSGEAIDDDQTSGISDIVVDKPVESMANDDNVYDLTGRIVAKGSLQGLKPGIYIHKGSKYYIK